MLICPNCALKLMLMAERFLEITEELLNKCERYVCSWLPGVEFVLAPTSSKWSSKTENSDLRVATLQTLPVANISDYFENDKKRRRIRDVMEATQINCNIPILNLWRGNMDITKLVGDAFGAVVYIALYTSKVDNKAEIRDILAKLKLVPDDQSTAGQLRKALLSLSQHVQSGWCAGGCFKYLRSQTLEYLIHNKENFNASIFASSLLRSK